MPDYQHVLLEKDTDAHIAKLTLNRPDRLNAMNDVMIDEIGDAVEDVSRDDDMRVLIITGSGRAFCSGADLRTLKGGSDPGSLVSDNPEDIRRGFEHIQRFIMEIHRMEKPVIAMVNGIAAGAGFDIACVCDIRVGSPHARFMSAYVRVGLFPGFGGTWLYPRALGSVSKAAELLFTGDFLESDEAKDLGFLNKLVPPEELESATLEMAQKIAAGPPIAIRLSKLMLYKGLEFDLETAMKMAAAAETITLTSRDHEEGTTAIRESRKPTYEGR